MSIYISLMIAIIFEVIGTLLLPVSNNFTKLMPTLALIVSYIISFYILAFVTQKLPIAAVYATWSGIGIVLVSIFGYVFHKQPLSWPVIFSLIITIIGVVSVNLFSEHL